MMQIKVFEDTMQSGYAIVERKANEFLKGIDDDAIVSITPNLCGVGSDEDEGIYQAYSITIVFVAS